MQSRNLSSSTVSSHPMHHAYRFFSVIAALGLLWTPSMSWGQSRSRLPRTGFEVYLNGSPTACVGRSYQLRGVAYEVRGLADLVVLPRARVKARYMSRANNVSPGTWSTTTADGSGRFTAELQIPQGADAPSLVEVVVGLDDDERRVTLPLRLVSPYDVQLLTDRVIYEPGERVNAWVRVWDRVSLAPIDNVPVEAFWGFDDVAASRTLETSSAGVVSFSFDLPESAREGQRNIEVTIGEGAAAREERATFRVSQRTVDRLTARLEITPETAAPEETVTARINVRTPSGAPVRGAQVRLIVDQRGHLPPVETDSSGVATASFRAPAYLEGDARAVAIRGTVSHPAHGSIDISGSLGVTRTHVLRIDSVVPHGGLIPEINDELIISILDGSGEAPPEGTMVEVSGHALRGGRVRREVDRNGFISVPTRTPVNAFAVHQGEGACSERPSTTVDVAVEGDQLRTAHLCIPVLTDALVAPIVARPVVAPGEAIEVRVERRPAVARRPVVVDLIDGTGAVVETALARPGTARVSLTAPLDRLGLFAVRARPVLNEGAAEGTGAVEALIVRPLHPSFVSLDADRDVYGIRETASITVRTHPEGGPGWVALLARDLSMHGGERPFGYRFLRGSFDQAVLDPSTPEAILLIRAALAAHASADAQPVTSPPLVDEIGNVVQDRLNPTPGVRRGDLRDPVARGEELRRRGVQRIMAGIENALSEALEEGRVDELIEGEGARRRFRQDIVQRVFNGRRRSGAPRTLGGGGITMAMLTASDPSFTFRTVAMRVARQRLVQLLGALASYLDPTGYSDMDRQRGASREPPEWWLSRMVQSGLVSPTNLHDPWGRTFVLRRTGRRPALSIAVEAAGLELLSPGPDGIVGNADDIRNPFARVVPVGTPYAIASGEEALMAALSRMSPGEEALAALREAYRRMSDATIEEFIGDVAFGSDSENALGALMGNQIGDNFGYGGLGLRGTGRGGGGSGSGTIGQNNLSVMGGGIGQALGSLVRERFPATLLFEPETALDPSGQTVIELELADAITTYIIEAIVWTGDGWVWSGSTRVRVDQELVVDAPVPPFATVGDRLRLPLRVSTRTKAPQRVRLRAEGSKQLGLSPVVTDEILVPGSDARDVPVELAFTKRGEGTITVSAHGPDGGGLDATKRPVTVLDDSRRVRDELETIVDGHGELSLEVPTEALERRGSEVELALGTALFRSGDGADLAWEAWVEAFEGRGDLDPQAESSALQELQRGIETRTHHTVARDVGALWGSDAASEYLLSRGTILISEAVGGEPLDTVEALLSEARILLLLSPAIHRSGSNPDLDSGLRELTGRLRQRLEEGAALFNDVPWLWVQVAASLLWSGNDDQQEARAIELLRRVRRSLIIVGEDIWLEGGAEDRGEQMIRATALLALCEIRLGNRQRAFRLVRTAARLTLADRGTMLEARALSTEDRAMAQVAAKTLMDGSSADAVTLRIDGVAQQVSLERGAASIPAETLGRPGHHVVVIDAPSGTVALLRLRAQYGLPWDLRPPPADRGPLAISIEGETGVLDSRSGLRLMVRNIAPRLVATPVIEIDVPAGVELDAYARGRIESQTVATPDFSGRTLTVTLSPLCPGGSAMVELPLRWSVAGDLRGLGAVGYAADRPRSVSILPSRAVSIEAH